MFHSYKSDPVGSLRDIQGTVAVKVRARGNVWRMPATPGLLHPRDLFAASAAIARAAGYEFDDPQFAAFTEKDWTKWAISILQETDLERLNAFLGGLQLYGYPVPFKFTMVDTTLWPVPGAPKKDFHNT
jgi:hypothetical protein